MSLYKRKKVNAFGFVDVDDDDIAPVKTTSKSITPIQRKTVGSFGFLSNDDLAPIRTIETLSDKEDEEDEEERKWFNKGLFEDGWQAGDIAKAILGTATDLDQNVKAGLLGIGEKVVDAAATGIGALGGALGNERFKTKTKEFVAKDLYDEHKLAGNPMIASNPFSSVSHILGLNTDENSLLGEKSDDLAYSGGQLLGTIGLQAVGVPWWVTTGATNFGGEVETAFREGVNYKEAALRGGISAGADILTERLTGGIKFGGKALDDVLLRPLTQKISNKVARNLVNVGLDATGEGFEEVMASVANNLGEKLYNEDAKIKDLLFSEQAMDEYIESFVGGFVLGGGMGGSSAVQSIKTGRDYKTGLTDNEQKVVDAEVQKRISEKETDGKKTSMKEKTAIEKQVRNDLEKGYISIDSIESALGGETYSNYKAIADQDDAKVKELKDSKEALTKQLQELDNAPNTVGNSRKYDAVQKKIDEIEKALSEFGGNPDKTRLKAQLSQEVDTITQSDRFLRESYNEKSRRGQAYEADLTKYKSKEQQAIIQKAIDSKILNNTNRTHEFVDMISKIAADKGVSFDFTNNAKLKESGFAMEGKMVNGYVQGGNITLNIQSAKSLNKLVGHEITHVLEGIDLYTELQNAVKEYATTKGEYDTRLEALKTLYKDVDGAVVENELTADLIGDYLFTDEKFVNNLSTKNPNVFKKIYEEIKYLVKVATAGSKEARELERVKKLFDKAYKQTSSNQNDSVRYDIGYTKDNRAVVFIENDIFDGKFEELSNGEITKIAREEILKHRPGIPISGRLIKVTRKSARHFTNSGDSSYLKNNDRHLYADKLNVAQEIDDIIYASTDYVNENPEHDREDDIKEFARGTVLLDIAGKQYEAEVVVAYTIYDEMVFYDVQRLTPTAFELKDKRRSLNWLDKSYTSTSTAPLDNKSVAENDKKFNKFSLSEDNQDIAPIGNYNVYGKDIALEAPTRSDIPQQTDDIAPVRSDIQQNNSEVRRDFAPLTEEQANARDKERMAAEQPETMSKIAISNIAKELKGVLPFVVRGQVKRVEDMIQRYGDAENADPNALYMELKNEFSSNTIKRRIEEVADVQSAIRSTKILVSDSIKNDIADFNALRKNNFGKIRFAKDGLPVDTVYQELSMAYPNYFPDDIVNPSDQLMQMVEVANQSRYYNEEFNVDGKQIAQATNLVMDKVEEYKQAKAERERRKQESRAYLHANIMDKIKTTFADKGMDFDEVLKNAKNKSTFASVDNTPQRFIEKTFGYKEGQILNDLTMNQTALNESKGIKWLNSFTNRKNGVLAQIVKQYGIKPRSKESAAAQMYGEGFYVNDKNELVEYGEKELMRDFPDAKVRDNIRKLAIDPRIRQIYDETLNKINESRIRNAYPEIPRRDNYFLHFRAMDDTFSRLGLPFNPNDIRAKDLPTDLNGVTADLKPGQPYFASSMQRKGHKTTYDLLGGLEKYLTSAKNQIYHIDDIQTLRALRNYVADMFGQAHGLDNIDLMSEEEVEERIKDVFNSHLSTFSRFLTEEANVLAGKTSMIDRSLEGILGRRAVTTLDTINKQVASNMIGFNISSSLTNLISVVQGFSKANKADAIKAFAQVAANKVNSIYGRSDGFADQNPLIIRRKGAEAFTRTPYQRVGDAGFIFMSAIDNVSTEFIVRAKYNELTRKGMESEKAHIESSKWAARILGDRSYGQQPLIFNSKTLGLFTKFQLEVRNQLDSMFYDTIQEAKLSTEDMQNGFRKNAVTAAKVTATLAQLAVLQHLFGKGFETIAGYNPTFDIVSTIMTACGFDDEEDSEDTPLDNLEQAFLELLEDLPYTSTLTGGRIPISSALPIEQLVTGVDDYGNEKSRLETLKEIAPYYVMPTGYNQLKKTVQGLGMFDDDLPVSGSYTDSGNLRFPVEDTLQNKVQAGLFGQWANENARDYFDNERAPLKEKQIQEYVDLDIPIRDYWDYREGLSEYDTLSEKADYINSLDLPVSKKNIMINNVANRKEPIDMSDYDKFADFEEFDYAVKNPEKYQFLQSNNISYKEYLSDEDRKEDIDNTYSWMKNNPEKYELSKAVTDDVFEYKKYTNDIGELDAKNEKGETVSGLKKQRVWDYIDSLDIEDAQKYILFKSQNYKISNSNCYEIINYLNERDDISAAEMKIILLELDFKVDDEGYISW